METSGEAMETPGTYTIITSSKNDTECCLPISKIVVSSIEMVNILELFVHTTPAAFFSGRRSFISLIIFPNIQKTINKVLSNVVQVVIDVIGVITNIINIIVFSKIGFNDGVTIALFGLAFSDLGYLFLSGVSQALDILDAAVGLRPFEFFRHLAFQVLWWNNMFYDITIFITVFNAVQKCACVAIPLIFKSIFTRFRSIIIVSVIYAAVFVYYIPTFANPGTDTTFDYEANWTRLGNFYRTNNDVVYAIFQAFSRIFLPFASQAVVLFCMIVLTIKLKAAQRNRRSMGLGRELSERYDNEASRKKDRNSAKELRAIQTVMLVSAIFVVCNLPDILITFTEKVFPEFSDRSQYEQTYRMCSAIQDIFAVTNSTVNIIVYLKYNTRYRRKFKEIMAALLCFRVRYRS